jgi:hypothetical protein
MGHAMGFESLVDSGFKVVLVAVDADGVEKTAELSNLFDGRWGEWS